MNYIAIPWKFELFVVFINTNYNISWEQKMEWFVFWKQKYSPFALHIYLFVNITFHSIDMWREISPYIKKLKVYTCLVKFFMCLIKHHDMKTCNKNISVIRIWIASKISTAILANHFNRRGYSRSTNWHEKGVNVVTFLCGRSYVRAKKEKKRNF
jgi:hypothetical protein